MRRCLLLDRDALLGCRASLRAGAELGAILLWFYVADRTPAIAAGVKSYSRDVFISTFFALTAVAVGYSATPGRAPLALNRHQTEEWKGWMQVRTGRMEGRRVCRCVCKRAGVVATDGRMHRAPA